MYPLGLFGEYICRVYYGACFGDFNVAGANFLKKILPWHHSLAFERLWHSFCFLGFLGLWQFRPQFAFLTVQEWGRHIAFFLVGAICLGVVL